jgi:hypothetical protein
MENSTDRELEAILKLIELTQDGSLHWAPAQQTGDLFDTDSIKYTNIMQCIYEGKCLRIYTEKKLKEKPNNRLGLSLSDLLSIEDQSYPYWYEKSVLEICNEKGQSLWRFGYKPAIRDLLNAVKYQVSGVKELLDSILKK